MGLASVLTLGFVMLTDRPRGRHPDAVMAAFVMVLVWAVSACADAFLSPPESKLLNPVIDASLAIGIGWAWVTHRQAWKALFLALLAVQSLAHVGYQAEYRAPGVLHSYIAILNLTFLAQLVCVAMPGAGYVAGWIGGHLRAHRDPHHFPGVWS